MKLIRVIKYTMCIINTLSIIIVFYLLQRVTLLHHTNQNRQKTENWTMTKIKADGCDKYQNKVIRVNLSVPAVPPTDTSSSKIIKVRYVIRVS